MTTIYFMIFITFVISLIVTPLVIKFAVKHGLVDIPKDERRVHAKPMPRIGGLSIIISVFIGLMIYFIMTLNATPISNLSLKGSKEFLGYLIGAFFIALMGIIDDAINLRARYKFIFQMLAGISVFVCGIRIQVVEIPFFDMVNLDILSFPVTMFWVIGLTCAVNLIDGLDGLAAGISAIASVALLTVFLATSASLEAIIITAVLVGSLIGFIPYNFNPAKTFMGDTGSNFLGFTLSVVSILGFAKGYTFIAIFVPILALGVPIFDTVFAMVRRFLAGVPLLTPDGAHIHHRLLKHGLNQKQAVYLLYIITSILCIISVTLVSRNLYKVLLLVIATILFIILAIINTIRMRNIKKLEPVLSKENIIDNESKTE